MKVKFLPQDKEFEIDSNESVLDLAKREGIFIKYLCNGQASCVECRVRVTKGEHNVVSPNAKEISQIGSMYYVDNRRLACQLRCFGDVEIDTSDHVGKEGTTVKRARGIKEESKAVTGQMFAARSAVDEDEKKANELMMKQERDQLLRKLKDEKKRSSGGFYNDLKSGVDYRGYDADDRRRKPSKNNRKKKKWDEGEEKELDLSQVDENKDLDLNAKGGQKKSHRRRPNNGNKKSSGSGGNRNRNRRPKNNRDKDNPNK